MDSPLIHIMKWSRGRMQTVGRYSHYLVHQTCACQRLNKCYTLTVILGVNVLSSSIAGT
jgi:hypothetical protein